MQLNERSENETNQAVGYDQLLAAKVAQDTKGIQSHYDLPVEFFASFLGPRMAYSCAYFKDADNSLAQADEDKLCLTAQKLELQPGDRVLDIGCGWGSFLFFAAEEYGCSATGITLSKEQVRHVNSLAARKGLGDRVKAELIHVYNMRYPADSFDKVVTIGAIEHIEDLDRTFRKTSTVMTDEGLFMCHGMTKPWESRVRGIQEPNDEISEIVTKHFGVGHWKSFWEVAKSLEQAGFEVLDEENITQHYALTCTRWLESLVAKEKEIADVTIPDEKYREFVALMAGYVTAFELSGTICNQILSQKHKLGRPRPVRPLTRRHMLVGRPGRDGPEQRGDEQAVSVGAVDRLERGRRRRRVERAMVRRDEACRARDPELRELFEVRLAKTVASHPELADQIEGVLTLRLTGENGCVYSLDMSDEAAVVMPGDCDDAVCRVAMEANEFKRLLGEGTVTQWLDAFKARRMDFEGSLITAYRLQNIIGQMSGNPETKRQMSG